LSKRVGESPDLIGVRPKESVHVGATEANNVAIKGLRPVVCGNHVITCATEPSAAITGWPVTNLVAYG
jgi:cysteine sulfinate desulfinase/cysteine desulfurase-like protein